MFLLWNDSQWALKNFGLTPEVGRPKPERMISHASSSKTIQLRASRNILVRAWKDWNCAQIGSFLLAWLETLPLECMLFHPCLQDAMDSRLHVTSGHSRLHITSCRSCSQELAKRRFPRVPLAMAKGKRDSKLSKKTVKKEGKKKRESKTEEKGKGKKQKKEQSSQSSSDSDSNQSSATSTEKATTKAIAAAFGLTHAQSNVKRHVYVLSLQFHLLDISFQTSILMALLDSWFSPPCAQNCTTLVWGNLSAFDLLDEFRPYRTWMFSSWPLPLPMSSPVVLSSCWWPWEVNCTKLLSHQKNCIVVSSLPDKSSKLSHLAGLSLTRKSDASGGTNRF